MTNSAIEAEGLVRTFGRVRALDGIDLVAREGTVFGLLGPNGAGKTTAIRVLSTLLRPDAGRAVVGGYVVRDRKLRSLNGRYVYADLCAGELRSFVPGLDGARKDRAVGPTVPSPTSFGEGPGGRIYVASHGGRVWKLK